MNIDAKEVITELRRVIDRDNSKTKILAASFKNVGQVNAYYECGAHAATMGVDILDSAFDMPSINKAVADFSSDWQSVYGTTSLDVQPELLV